MTNKMFSFSMAVVSLGAATMASAATVNDTSLVQLNGPFGSGTATTTTNGTGTRTVVTGPGGSGNRASATPVVGVWSQANVGGGGTVGITNDFARSGNGSAYFSTVNGDSKGDLQYRFGSVLALSDLSSVSFDFFRSSTSVIDANLAPVLRFDMLKNGNFAGSLVFENVYQAQTTAPVDTWTTLTANLNSGIWWATNASLGPTFANANGGQKTLAQWIADNGNATLTTYGMTIGVGSGWNGTFRGGVDNVNVAFGDIVSQSNFEVAPQQGAVPEPSTWLMMIAGFGLTGLAMRRGRTGKRYDTLIKTNG